MNDTRFNAQNEAIARLLCQQRGLNWDLIGEDGDDWARPLDEPRRCDFRSWATAIQLTALSTEEP